jgi:hypothetical protein
MSRRSDPEGSDLSYCWFFCGLEVDGLNLNFVKNIPCCVSGLTNIFLFLQEIWKAWQKIRWQR